MKLSEQVVWKIYSGVLGAVTTLVAQKLVTKAWNVATGEEPPNPNDPDVPFSEAVAWALSLGVGVGVAQLSMNRFMSRRWADGRQPGETKLLRNRLTD